MNIAMISLWHVHAKGYANEIKDTIKGGNVTAVWDENPTEGKKWADELGCTFFEDYDKLLEDSSIDGIVICSATSEHKSLIIKAANAGKHIFTEKVLAFSSCDCEEIKSAIERAGVTFTISFPHKCRAELLLAKKIADSGELGDITYARVRNAHNGSIAGWLPEHFYNKEQCGGGAMIDLGAHTMYLLEWFLGMPKKTSSVFTSVTGKGVEDNAVSVMEFSGGAIGVAETGFVSSNDPFTLDLAGTKGSLQVRDGLSYCTPATGGWIKAEELPDAMPSPLCQWVECVENKKKPLFDIEDAIKLTKMMELAYGC